MTLRADPADQRRLLEVQELDTRLDQLRYQAAHLPEAQELATTQARRAELERLVAELQTRADDLARAQRKADDDVEQVRARRTRDQQRLDSGAVSTPKDLEHLQSELASLDRRIGDLEDAELEIMEELESAQRELEGARAQLSELEERVATLHDARDARLADLRAEAGGLRRTREEIVGGVAEVLLTLYDRLRQQKDGVGAALLRARRCQGCSLELNSSDLAAISRQPEDAVVRCEECGRILVRTPDSGL